MVLINQADTRSAGGVALHVRTQARGLDTEASNAIIGGVNDLNASQYQAGMQRYNARIGNGTTLLSGASTMFSRWGQRNLNDMQSKIDAYQGIGRDTLTWRINPRGKRAPGICRWSEIRWLGFGGRTEEVGDE